MFASLKREKIFAIALIVLTTLLAYGVLVTQLGYYRDDWYLVWTAQAQGTPGLVNLFRGDRPFIGWLYALDFSIVGTSPLHWQVYGWLIKLAAALACLWLMRSLWPQQKTQATIITLLYVIYPGYYQQPNALTFKMLMSAYTAALLSLTLTIYMIRSDRLAYKILLFTVSLVLAAYYLFIYEALVGLEVVRLILIAYIMRRESADWKSTLRSAWKSAMPYLIFAALFVLWRVFLFHSTRNATDSGNIAASFTSMHGFIRFLVEGGKDLIETSILSWGVPFYQFSYQGTYSDFGLALGLAALVAAAAGAYLYFTRTESEVQEEAAPDWLILGALIVLVTTIPIVAAGRNALFGIQWDRYTYQSSIGAAMLATGFVFYALRGKLRWVILGMLIVSGVATQVFSAIYYRDFWTAERNVWWQLYWRAPQIADGTTLIASLPGAFQVAEEYEVWGPLNLVYHPGHELLLAGQIPIEHLDVQLQRGTVEDRIVRDAITVHRDYGRAIVASMPTETSCLHVYSTTPSDISLLEPQNIAAMIPYSKTNLVHSGALSSRPPLAFFGAEPTHDWCFYYQKIRLALQSGEWARAAQLADQAQAHDLQPFDATEWMAVFEAYANNGEDRKAKHASTLINDKDTRLYLCQQLKAIQNWPLGYRSQVILEDLCSVP